MRHQRQSFVCGVGICFVCLYVLRPSIARWYYGLFSHTHASRISFRNPNHTENARSEHTMTRKNALKLQLVRGQPRTRTRVLVLTLLHIIK